MKSFIIIAIILLLVSCGSGRTQENIDANNALIETIMKEDKVAVEAIITDTDVLYVSVKDDGTSRDGLASYFCNYKSEFPKSTFKSVKIVEAGTTNSSNKDNAYGVLLGEHYCN